MEEIVLSGEFSIFGAGRAATSIAEAIYGLWGRKPYCFVVSNQAGAPRELCSCPVIGLEQYTQHQSEVLLIAVPETQVVEDACRDRDISYLCVSGDTENRLLYALYQREGRFRVFCKEDEKARTTEKISCRVYMAKSRYDKDLKHAYRLPSYVSSIFVGAACVQTSSEQSITEENVQIGAMFRDDIGDNISLQNPYYCELTALYWTWKNAKEDYVGLCHYRRIFELTDGELAALLAKRPDVVLLYPSMQYPNAGRHEKRYLGDDVRQAVREALKMQSAELYEDYERVMNDKYIYHFNMLIAKKETLDKYCEWLFRTIRQIEDICRERGTAVEKRQQGYWAENLMSLYFLINKEEISIYHVGHRLLT